MRNQKLQMENGKCFPSSFILHPSSFILLNMPGEHKSQTDFYHRIRNNLEFRQKSS
jgi:hypothetical protein